MSFHQARCKSTLSELILIFQDLFSWVENFLSRSRNFFTGREFFTGRVFFLAAREVFAPVENVFCRSRIFWPVENFLHRSRKFFVGREFFDRSRMFFGRPRIVSLGRKGFGRSRVFLVVEKFFGLSIERNPKSWTRNFCGQRGFRAKT